MDSISVWLIGRASSIICCDNSWQKGSTQINIKKKGNCFPQKWMEINQYFNTSFKLSMENYTFFFFFQEILSAQLRNINRYIILVSQTTVCRLQLLVLRVKALPESVKSTNCSTFWPLVSVSFHSIPQFKVSSLAACRSTECPLQQWPLTGMSVSTTGSSGALFTLTTPGLLPVFVCTHKKKHGPLYKQSSIIQTQTWQRTNLHQFKASWFIIEAPLSPLNAGIGKLHLRVLETSATEVHLWMTNVPVGICTCLLWE